MRYSSIAGSLATALLALMLGACGQDLGKIVIVNPEAPTIQLKCGVKPQREVSIKQAFCIAKLAGLEAGIRRWGVHVYTDHLDVYNTISDGPTSQASGMSIRMTRIGGNIVEMKPWKEIVLD
jgi:hypothetical protein